MEWCLDLAQLGVASVQLVVHLLLPEREAVERGQVHLVRVRVRLRLRARVVRDRVRVSRREGTGPPG